MTNRGIGIVGTLFTSAVALWLVVNGAYAGIVRRGVQRSYRRGDYVRGRSAVIEGVFRVVLGSAILALNAWLILHGKLS